MANLIFVSVLMISRVLFHDIEKETINHMCISSICFTSTVMLFHIYVIFSYNFKVPSIKEPIQYLFVSLSIYEAFSCFLFGSWFAMELIPDFYFDSFGYTLKSNILPPQLLIIFFSSMDIIGRPLKP